MGRGAMASPEEEFLSKADRAAIFGIECAESLEWRNWEVGGEYTRTLLVKNVSTQTQKIRYKLPATKCFTMDFPETIKLAPGTNIPIVVTFQPVKREAYADHIAFNCNAGSFYVPVRAHLPYSAIEVPRTLEFGYCPAKETATMTCTFMNTGELTVEYRWRLDQPFSLSPEIGRLRPGEVQTVTATFHPEDASVFSAEACCMMGEDIAAVMQVSGIGKYPYISTAEQNLQFGEVLIGKAVDKTIRLTNQSMVPAYYTVSRLEAEHDRVFSIVPTTGVIAAGGYDSIKISYTPQAEGCFTSENFTVSTAGGNVLRLNCKGSARGPTCNLSLETVNFGNVEVGGTSTRVIYVENSTPSNIGFQFLAEPHGVFSFDRVVGTVGPDSSVHVSITYEPKEPGNYHRRVMVLLKDRSPLVFEILGTAYSGKRRPPPLQQKHVCAYYHRVDSQLPPLPQEGEAPMLDMGDERWVSSLTADGLWREAFEPDRMKPVALSSQEVDFGACSRLRMSEYKQVELTNNTGAKITSFWTVPTDPEGIMIGETPRPMFNVFPEQADIKPGHSQVFRIGFRPGRDAHYYSQHLECYSYVKTMRNFRLVTEENFSPPWCLSVQAIGHTFLGSGEEFTPKAEFTTKRVQFPPCEVGQSTYTTVALVNNGDTPIKYAFPDYAKMGYQEDLALSVEAGSGVYKVHPASGIIPSHQFAIVSFRFSSLLAQTFTEKLTCMLNNSPTNLLELTLSGTASIPRLKLDSSSVYFKPTCVGATSMRHVQLRNTSRIPVHFQWVIPEKMQGMFSITPPAGLLRGNEDTNIDMSFAPQRQREVTCKAVCLFASAASPELIEELTLESPGVDRMVAAMIGTGTPGAVTVSPATLDFGTVLCGESKKLELLIYNHSSGNLQYVLDLHVLASFGEGANAALKADGSKVLSVDVPHGILPARAHKAVKVTFAPDGRANYTFSLACRTSSGPVPLLLPTPETALQGDDAKLEVADENGNPLDLVSTMEDGDLWLNLPSAEITACADYPILSISDIRCSSVGRTQSKSTLWKQHRLDVINAELATVLSPAELALNNTDRHITRREMMKPLTAINSNFGTQAAGSDPTVVYLQFANHSAVDLDWEIVFRNDSEVDLENWVDVGQPTTKEDAHERMVLEKKVFDVHPRSDKLKPGEMGLVTVTYLHEYPGKHRLPLMLSIKNGKRICVNLIGRTVAEDAQRMELPAAAHALAPVPIGETNPPVQQFPLRNTGPAEVRYRVDTSVCDELEKASHGFRVLECLNPEGVIPAGCTAQLNWIFQPIEAKMYTADVAMEIAADDPSVIVGPQSNVVSFSARGYHPKQTGVDKLSIAEKCWDKVNWAGWNPAPSIVTPGQQAHLSLDHLALGPVPTLSVSRRVIGMTNDSETTKYFFSWSMFMAETTDGDLKLEPMSGEILPGETLLVKVSFTASGRPQNWDMELCCDFTPEALPPMPETPPETEELVLADGLDFVPKRPKAKTGKRQLVANTSNYTTTSKFPAMSMHPKPAT
ncbi:hypothetical protein CYMTET_5071, partial [Cymbomonas tetramitiformis]